MEKTAAPESSRDGRTERSERTRDAVVNALLDLIEEGDLRPTAPRIAERAGVSLRTVFHHYEDLEELFSVAAQRQMERHLNKVPHVPRNAPLEARIDALVVARAAVHEAITPVRRAALLSEPFSPVIARHLKWIRDRGRTEVEHVFDAELRQRSASKRHDLVEALTAASSWSTWEALRAHQGLTPVQARRVMKRMISALLEQE